MEVIRLTADDHDALAAMLRLVRHAFAHMDGVVDPPSSVHRLTVDDLGHGPGEPWVIGEPPAACVVLTPRNEALYIGKLAVVPEHRGAGLARRLVDHADERARSLGLGWLELEVRVELLQNQRVFIALGFAEVGRRAHAGYSRPTSITYRRAVSAA